MRETSTKANRIERIALACSTVGGLLLSGGVVACILYLLLTLASLVTVQPALAQSSPAGAGVRLEAGIEKEDVDGDLKSAMDIYQKIAADSLAPRDVRARALLRLAGCDEKLGQHAKQIYEEIVHDYPDQPAAAQARSRLAILKQHTTFGSPAAMTARKIEWSGDGLMDESETDGQRGIFQTPEGAIYLEDFVTRSKQLIFKTASDAFVYKSAKDLSKVALLLRGNPDRPAKLAVIRADGTGYRELIVDDSAHSLLGDGSAINLSWSRDNRKLLLSANLVQSSGSRLWIVSEEDGRRHLLAHPETGSISNAAFSPDGRFVAYEISPPGDQMQHGMCRILVVPATGGDSRFVYQSKSWHEGHSFSSLKDWTADGHFLILKDLDVLGSAMYLLPIKDGDAAGAAVMIRYGNFVSASTTASGSLIFKDVSTRPRETTVYLASFDPEGHVDRWKRMDLRGSQLTNFRPCPSFSPDGQAVVYTAPEEGSDKIDVIRRELVTGKERVLYSAAHRSNLICQYAAHEPRVLCGSWNDSDSTDLMAVEVESGKVEQLGSVQGPKYVAYVSRDDRSLYLVNFSGQEVGSLSRWDFQAKNETTVAVRSNPAEIYVPSPDGQWLVRGKLNSSMDVRSMTGRDWKTLLANAGGLWMQTVITSDSKWVLYHTRDSSGKDGLFRVPISGGPQERVGDFPCGRLNGYLYLSADDRQVMASCLGFESPYDLWMLENFEPSDKK
jgi:Tol biopolymer transport system component